MGSFGASCSLTKLPLNPSEKCMFLPIIPSSDYKGKRRALPSSQLMVYNTDMYSPGMLPIEGEYNTYGSIENITKNINTSIIQEKYGRSIEDIVETINSGRGIFESHGNISKIWGIKKINDSIKELIDIGFLMKRSQNDDGSSSQYLFHDELNLKLENQLASGKFEINNRYSITYLYTPETSHYERIISKEYGKELPQEEYISIDLEIPEHNGSSIQTEIYNKIGEIIGLKNQEDKQKIIDLTSMGGMFFDGKAYEKMSNIYFDEFKGIFPIEDSIKFEKVSGVHLEKFGFQDIGEKNDRVRTFKLNEIEVKVEEYSSKIIRKSGISNCYNIKEFLENFNKANIEFNNEEKILDLNIIKDLYGSNLSFIKFSKEIEMIKDGFKDSNADKGAINHFIKGALSNYSDRFFYKDEHMKDLYLQSTTNSEMFKVFDQFKSFQHSMVATNTLYIPSYCGYQEGALKINKYLAEVTNEIIERDSFEEEIEIDLKNNMVIQ